MQSTSGPEGQPPGAPQEASRGGSPHPDAVPVAVAPPSEPPRHIARGRKALLWIGGILPALVVIGVIGNRYEAQPSGEHWRKVGGLADGMRAKFVEVDPDRVTDRRIYDDAVQRLCYGESTCVIAFFAQGDRIPPSGSAHDFLAAGAFVGYRPLAMWWGNANTASYEFTQWDCARAGFAGAPASALCGPGVKEAYGAVIALGTRLGMAGPCKWPNPPTSDATLVSQYIARQNDPEKRAQLQKAYDMFSVSKGPEDLGKCRSLRNKIESEAAAARRTLTAS